MRPKAIVYHCSISFLSFHFWLVIAKKVTHVDNALKLAKDSSHRLSNDGHGVEKASLADQDVEQGLVHADKLAECIEDGIGIGAGGDGIGSLHLCNGGSGGGDDVGEASNDLRERTLADDDERPVEDGDGLGGSLDGLRLGGEHLNV